MQETIIAVREQYLWAQMTGDQRSALEVVLAALVRGHSVRAIQQDVIQAAQREIGQLWQENRLSIAHEHIATAISQMALVHLFAHAPAPRARGRTIVVACVEGELHDLPARLVADYLEIDGFTVRFLGANVPTESLCPVLVEEPPDLLALSVTMAFNVASLRSAVATVRRCCPGLKIVIGGHALTWAPEVAEQLGLLAVGGVADDILAGIEQQLPGGPR